MRWMRWMLFFLLKCYAKRLSALGSRLSAIFLLRSFHHLFFLFPLIFSMARERASDRFLW